MTKKYYKKFTNKALPAALSCILAASVLSACDTGTRVSPDTEPGITRLAAGISKIASGHQAADISFTPSHFSEGILQLDNPYRGFYYLCGFMPHESLTPKSQKDKLDLNLSTVNTGLLLLQINLKNYSKEDLSKNALDQISAILDRAREQEKVVILRFLYDWDNQALISEPDNIEQIGRHITQVGAVTNEYKDIVFLVQGTFTGNCGEMHHSFYTDIEDYRFLAEKLEQSFDPDIYLSVRTPWQLRGITGSMLPVSADNAYDGSLSARLGIFNDGMLGSDTDLGSYAAADGDSDAANADAPGFETLLPRSDELDFQEKICRYVPCGGEAVTSPGNESYSDLANAIADMRRIKVSYLNYAHDLNVINKWKSTTYFGEDVFDGMTGYEYIDAHLGYRYMVTEADAFIPEDATDMVQVEFTVENRGFAPTYRDFDCQLLIGRATEGNKLSSPQRYDCDIDFRTLDGGSSLSYSVRVPLSEITKKSGSSYLIALKVTDPVIEKDILFANDYSNTNEDGEVILGNLEIN